MGTFLSELVPVVIEASCEQWGDERVIELFGRMCDLKMKGYCTKYPSGVLPIDTTDFIGAHILICLRTTKGLLPISGHKTTELATCRHYQVEFPGLSLVKRAGGAKHIEAVEKLVRLSQEEGEGLAYSGSWTVDPDIALGREERIILRELFEATYTQFYLDKGIRHSLLGGTLRFKTEKIFSKMGFRPLEENGDALPNIQVTHLQGEPVMVMYTREFSPYALQRAEKYQAWWSRRQMFTANSQPAENLTAA